jgi:hypothetical protein
LPRAIDHLHASSRTLHWAFPVSPFFHARTSASPRPLGVTQESASQRRGPNAQRRSMTLSGKLPRADFFWSRRTRGGRELFQVGLLARVRGISQPTEDGLQASLMDQAQLGQAPIPSVWVPYSSGRATWWLERRATSLLGSPCRSVVHAPPRIWKTPPTEPAASLIRQRVRSAFPTTEASCGEPHRPLGLCFPRKILWLRCTVHHVSSDLDFGLGAVLGFVAQRSKQTTAPLGRRVSGKLRELFVAQTKDASLGSIHPFLQF